MSLDPSTQAPLPAAAVARRLGIAPATLRTWDRRYGLGPTSHEPGHHRRYTAADLARLESIQALVRQGVTVADAAAHVEARATRRQRPRPRAAAQPAERNGSTGTSRRVTGRQLREAALRLDSDRVTTLLNGSLADLGVIATWDTVVRPALVWLGERWQVSDGCIAAEHVLSECAAAVFTSAARRSPTAPTRPVLLLSAPGDEHILPLHALAAALAERRVRNCVVGPSTPLGVAAEAIRRLNPTAVLVWSQVPETADLAALTAQPKIRAGHRTAAVGPGWAHARLPARVDNPQSISAAVELLTSPA